MAGSRLPVSVGGRVGSKGEKIIEAVIFVRFLIMAAV